MAGFSAVLRRSGIFDRRLVFGGLQLVFWRWLLDDCAYSILRHPR
jgi:hypothetical protein